MKKIVILLAAVMLTLSAAAQTKKGNLEIKGTLYDFESAEPLYPANVQIFSLPDSTYITGTSSAENGSFTISGLAAGQYVLRASFMGYVTTDKTFTLRSSSRAMDLGKITLKADAVILKEVAVTAALAKVQMVGDTVVFNSDAYHLPEGATVEDLVRRLPGVQISSDGNITVNGKTVSRILVNGKEFFDNDKSVAMQNLTADMIEKVKAYDKQSDNARMTGMDDGNEETVIDLQVKKGMAQGWFGNISAGYGRPTQENIYNLNDLYTTQVTLNHFNEDRQFTITGSYGNTMRGGIGGFGGMRGMGMGGGMRGGGGGGVTTTAQVGANFATNIGEEVYSDSYEWEVGGSINYSHSSSDSQSKSESEFFNQGITTFSTSESRNLNTNDNVNGQMRIEWNRDRYTSMVFTPSVSYSRSNGSSTNQSLTFGRDPRNYYDNPFELFQHLDTVSNLNNPDFAMDYLDSLYDAMTNSQNSRSKSESSSWSTSGNLQFVQRLNDVGRNISFRGSYSYSDGDNQSYSRNEQMTNNVFTGGKNKTILNRYNDNPSPSVSANASLSYTEPLQNNFYLQASYQFSYRHSNSDRATYDLGALYNPTWGINDQWDLQNGWENLRSEDLSQKNYYDNLDQTIQLQLRKQDNQKYNFTAGISLLPQHSKTNYSYMNVKDTLISRNVFNWTPTVNFRYRWTRQEQINLSYNGRSSQPSINQLMDITDDSNPLSISKGNPGLKPTFANQFRVNYSNYNPTTMFSVNLGANFGNTMRSISSVQAMDKQTRMTITQPFNMEFDNFIDNFLANWNGGLNAGINVAMLDSRVTLSSNTSANFQHQTGWSATFSQKDLGWTDANKRQKIREFRPVDFADYRRTNTLGLNQSLELSYRDDWIEVSLQGDGRYNHSTNDLQPERNMDTWDYSYGLSFSGLAPWHNLRLITDCMMSSRRGYSSKEMNTDELIWNAQASISFLKGNRGTLSLAIYDILKQRSMVSRSMTATSRRDTWNNNINSYFLCTFTYRIQMFGDREARQNMRMSRGMMGGGGMGGFGGGMGGFGGGMGGGFGGGFGGGGMF